MHSSLDVFVRYSRTYKHTTHFFSIRFSVWNTLNTCIHFRLHMQLLIRNISFGSFSFIPSLSLTLSQLPKEWAKIPKRHENKRNYNRYMLHGLLVCCFQIQLTGKISSFRWSSFQFVSIMLVCLFLYFFFLVRFFLLVFCCLCLSCSFSFQNDSIVIE